MSIVALGYLRRAGGVVGSDKTYKLTICQLIYVIDLVELSCIKKITTIVTQQVLKQNYIGTACRFLPGRALL